jgi:hypothetical protein
MVRGIFAVALEDDDVAPVDDTVASDDTAVVDPVVADPEMPPAVDAAVPDATDPSDGVVPGDDTVLDAPVSDEEVTADVDNSADSLGVELEPIESDGEAIDSQIGEVEFGIECLVTLESIVESVSLESLQEPAILNSVNISLESLCKKLGLEASDMVYHSEGSSSDSVKEHADKVKGKLAEVWERIVKFIKMLWTKLQEFLHRYTSIIAANLTNWTAGVNKKIKALPEEGNCYDNIVDINNMGLARAYSLNNGSGAVTIEKAEHMSDQLTYIYKALTVCFDNIKSAGKNTKVVDNGLIGDFIKPIKDQVLVNGIKVEGTSSGINVEYGKSPSSGEIKLHTPKSKSEMLDLNAKLKSHIYEVNLLFIRIYKDTEFQRHIVSNIKVAEFIGKVTKIDTSELMLIRYILEAALKFMKLMQGVATDTYRAVLKYLTVTCSEMEKLV